MQPHTALNRFTPKHCQDILYILSAMACLPPTFHSLLAVPTKRSGPTLAYESNSVPCGFSKALPSTFINPCHTHKEFSTQNNLKSLMTSNTVVQIHVLILLNHPHHYHLTPSRYWIRHTLCLFVHSHDVLFPLRRRYLMIPHTETLPKWLRWFCEK